ncbi:MAG: hypothetical protein HC867_07040 [Bacteroidia bacterium]|nr:hypothetical protein [Bacteroidia bacterium]
MLQVWQSIFHTHLHNRNCYFVLILKGYKRKE